MALAVVRAEVRAARALGRLLRAWYVLLSNNWTSTSKALSSIFLSSCSNWEPEEGRATQQPGPLYATRVAHVQHQPFGGGSHTDQNLSTRWRQDTHPVGGPPGSTLYRSIRRWGEPVGGEKEGTLFINSQAPWCVQGTRDQIRLERLEDVVLSEDKEWSKWQKSRWISKWAHFQVVLITKIKSSTIFKTWHSRNQTLDQIVTTIKAESAWHFAQSNTHSDLQFQSPGWSISTPR